jgi:F-type H+-transporting ATPase subunit b
MEILNNFGFEPVFFTAQIINFLILAFIFKKFLYAPILKIVNNREKKIAQGIKDAEAAKLALEEAETRKDDIIKAATIEAEKIIDETRENAKEMREELESVAKREADKIIAEGKATAEEEFKNAQRRAEAVTLDLSKKLLDRVLSEIFTKVEREKIVQRNVKVLKNYEQG